MVLRNVLIGIVIGPSLCLLCGFMFGPLFFLFVLFCLGYLWFVAFHPIVMLFNLFEYNYIDQKNRSPHILWVPRKFTTLYRFFRFYIELQRSFWDFRGHHNHFRLICGLAPTREETQ